MPTLAIYRKEAITMVSIIFQNALRQQKFVREVTIQYNLCNEPWYVLMILANDPKSTSSKINF